MKNITQMPQRKRPCGPSARRQLTRSFPSDEQDGDVDSSVWLFSSLVFQ